MFHRAAAAYHGVSLLIMRIAISTAAYTAAIATIATTYALLLHFRVATASLYDDYQPGIEALRAWVSPGLLLAVLVMSTALTGSYVLVKLAKRSCQAALVVCLLLFVYVSGHSASRTSWVFPEHRTLEATVLTAISHPSFSNRSKGSIIGSAIVAGFWLGVSSFVLRRRRLTMRSSGPPGEASDVS
jgi:hypothetical protein